MTSLHENIQADHKDLIHHVSYDFHGQRMATCSSDQYVKIWDQIDGKWVCTANWRAHSGSVWRVEWAHPEFGQIIATCSFDRTVIIWEELPGEASGSSILTGSGSKTSHWVKKTSLVDSRNSVTDVKFAPKHLGLQLASCSADCTVRFYEAPDIMKISCWNLLNEYTCKLCCSCISWNPSRAHAPMLAVGSDSDDKTAGSADIPRVLILEYCDNSRKWTRAEGLTSVTDPVRDVAFAPNLGRSHHLLAVASTDLQLFSLQPNRREGDNMSNEGTRFVCTRLMQFGDHGPRVWRLSWNVTGTVLASSGDDGYVRLWKGNYMDNWKCIGTLQSDGTSVRSQSAQSCDSTNVKFQKASAITHPNQVVWH